jgi:hypothetical protein
MPSIVTSSWLSASPPPIPPIIPGKMPWLTVFASFVYQPGYGARGSGARWWKSHSRHCAFSQIRSPLGLIAPHWP